MERSSPWCQANGYKQRSWDLGQAKGVRAVLGTTLPHGPPDSVWPDSARGTQNLGKKRNTQTAFSIPRAVLAWRH